MKLYYQRPELSSMVDKYEVKKYVSDRIGKEHVVECYGVWDKFEDIDFDQLPDQFVLKCTHTSGGVIICKDKGSFDKDAARKMFMHILNHNHYLFAREWAYKNVKPRIIAEKYLPSLGSLDSIEYKLTVMNGRVFTVTVCSGIAHSAYELRHNDNFSRDWNRQEWYARYTPTGKDFNMTPQIQRIIDFSEELAKGLPQVRVDWYIHEDQIYFGEFTFYTWSGWPHFTPKDWDYKMGEAFLLPSQKYIEK